MNAKMISRNLRNSRRVWSRRKNRNTRFLITNANAACGGVVIVNVLGGCRTWILED